MHENDNFLWIQVVCDLMLHYTIESFAITECADIHT